MADSKTYIHQAILVRVSKYFKAALDGNFREAEEKAITLSDVDIDAFEVFIDWIYTSNFEALEQAYRDLSEKCEKYDREDEKDEGQKAVLDQEEQSFRSILFRVYIFADAHEVPGLKRSTIDMLFDYLHNVYFRMPLADEMVWILTQLPKSDPLWRMLVDFFCLYEGARQGSIFKDGNQDCLPREFISAMLDRQNHVLRALTDESMTLDYDLTVCDYHEHVNKAERDNCS